MEEKYFGKVFFPDLKKLAERRPLAFSFEQPLELYLRMKCLIDSRSEMDQVFGQVSDRYYFWLGMVCPQIQGTPRKEILVYGLEMMHGRADGALLWKKDEEAIHPSLFEKVSLDPFVLATPSIRNVRGALPSLEKIVSRCNGKK